MRRIGILLFDDVEELDVVGPYEVLAWAAGARDGFAEVFTVSEGAEPVRCHKGMRIRGDHIFDTAPPLDIVSVPGGVETRAQVRNDRKLEYVRAQAGRAELVASVCTGVRVLLAAGPAVGRRATSHRSAIEELRA